MELALLVYAISALSGIHAFLVISLIIAGGFSLAGMIRWVSSRADRDTYYSSKEPTWHDDVEKKAVKTLKTGLVVVCLIGVTLAALPSKQTAWMMTGAYAGQKALESDTAKKLGAIVEIKLQEVLDEATEQAKKKAKSINKE